MKNNRLIYLLIIIITIWCVVLSVGTKNINTNNSEVVINETKVSGFSTDFTEVVDKTVSSIVTINASGSISSGFVYKQENNDVYIVTSYHSLSEANSYYVYFKSGFSINAELIGKDIYSDIAVLKINSPYIIDSLIIGDSQLLKSGEFIISIGTPETLEYANSVELGLISNAVYMIENSISYNETKYNYYLDAVQISANLKPGYSGSPIINMAGEVVGLVTMSLNEKTVFALTSNEMQIIADKIIDREEVKKYQLGIKGLYIENMPLYERSNLNLSVDTINGLYVSKVMDNSICALAGIKPGDVILSINSTSINNFVDTLKATYENTAAFEFVVLSNGMQNTLRIDIND